MGMGLGQYIGIAAYVCFAVAIVLSLFWKPKIGLYLLILTAPQERLVNRFVDFPLGEHVLVLLLLSVLAGAFLRGQFPKQSALNKVLIVFCALSFFSLIIGAFYMGPDTLLERLRHWKDYMCLPLLFVATSAVIQTKKEFQIAVVLVCLSVLLVNKSMAVELREHDNSHYSDSKREAGPFMNAGSNGAGAFEAQMAIFLVALAAFQKKWSRKLPLYGLIALTLFCLLFSFSRGGYLAFLGALFVYGVVHRRILVPILLAFMLAWQVFVPQSVIERVTMTETSNGQLEASAEARVTIWTDALNLIESNPILGSGYDTYEFMGRVGSFRDTHNMYVKTVVETGIVGLGVFLWILFTFWRLGWTLFKRAEDDLLFRSLGLGVAVTSVCVAIVNFFGDRWTYMGPNGLIWVLLGLAAVANSLLSKAPEQTEQMDTAHDEVEEPWAIAR